MVSSKSRLLSLWLCFLLGILGAHRFYLKKYLTGFLMLLTLGGLGIWIIIDYLLLLFGLLKDGDGLYVKTWSKSLAIPKIIISASAMAILIFGTSRNVKHIKIDKDFFTKKSQEVILQKSDTSSELIKYVDKRGVTHFVNDINKIPIEYRASSETNLKLPEVSKATYVLK